MLNIITATPTSHTQRNKYLTLIMLFISLHQIGNVKTGLLILNDRWKTAIISNLFWFKTERNFIFQVSKYCYFSLRCDVRLSCILVTTASINSGITTPLTSIKFATDLVTVVSLILPDEALLTDNTKLYLSSYFFK